MLGENATKIIEYRRNNPCFTQQRIADVFEQDTGKHISKQRVSQILKAAGEKTESVKWKAPKLCAKCGEPRETETKKKLCRKCRHELQSSNAVPVACHWCGKIRYVRQPLLMYRITVLHQEHFFCDRHCHGKHVGATIGFKKRYTPEEVAAHIRKSQREYLLKRKMGKRVSRPPKGPAFLLQAVC